MRHLALLALSATPALGHDATLAHAHTEGQGVFWLAVAVLALVVLAAISAWR